MTRPENEGLTELLRAAADGDRTASERVAEEIYAELHRIARTQMRQERPDHTLQPTILVNEALARLIGGGTDYGWNDTKHFLCVGARMMRRLLVDHAREHRAQKRETPGERISLESALAHYEHSIPDVLSVEEALERLEKRDPELVRLVELRLFGEQSFATISRVLGISMDRAKREWKTARAWLRKELE